jgi:hypothetical protein
LEISVYRDINNISLNLKDFIPIKRGEAAFSISNKGEPFLTVKEDKEFDLACKEGKMDLDIPTLRMTCCPFRLYKCKEYPVKINNPSETDAAFITRYQESLASEDRFIKNIIYWELFDFKTHNALIDDAASYLKLIFKVLLESQSIESSDDTLNLFIDNFVSWNKDLNGKNKIAFKKQVDLIIFLYFKKPSHTEAACMLNQIKSLNKLPVIPPFSLFGQSSSQQQQRHTVNTIHYSPNMSKNPS